MKCVSQIGLLANGHIDFQFGGKRSIELSCNTWELPDISGFVIILSALNMLRTNAVINLRIYSRNQNPIKTKDVLGYLIRYGAFLIICSTVRILSLVAIFSYLDFEISAMIVILMVGVPILLRLRKDNENSIRVVILNQTISLFIPTFWVEK